MQAVRGRRLPHSLGQLGCTSWGMHPTALFPQRPGPDLLSSCIVMFNLGAVGFIPPLQSTGKWTPARPGARHVDRRQHIWGSTRTLDDQLLQRVDPECRGSQPGSQGPPRSWRPVCRDLGEGQAYARCPKIPVCSLLAESARCRWLMGLCTHIPPALPAPGLQRRWYHKQTEFRWS